MLLPAALFDSLIDDPGPATGQEDTHMNLQYYFLSSLSTDKILKFNVFNYFL